MSDDAAIREEVAFGCRVLAHAGLNDAIWGHVSARASRPDAFWMKAGFVGLEEVAAADTILIDLDGNVLEGDRRPHDEWPIHAEALRARPDVGAVVHVHAEHSIAFGARDEPLRPVSTEGMRWAPPDIPRFVESADLITTPELGRKVAAAMGQAHGVLLRNHGVAVVGPDVRMACLMATFLERACRIQLLAMSAGPDYHWAPDDQVLARRVKMNVSHKLNSAWEYYRRRTAR